MSCEEGAVPLRQAIRCIGTLPMQSAYIDRPFPEHLTIPYPEISPWHVLFNGVVFIVEIWGFK